MSFMLPRLTLAHGLLRDDGIIAISIDDYEYAHLKIMMDTIFEEENYIATLVVCRSKNGKGGRANVAVNHEYVLVYGKTPSALLHGIAESDSGKYDREDEHGRFTIDGLFRKKGDASLREDRPNLFIRFTTLKMDRSMRIKLVTTFMRYFQWIPRGWSADGCGA